MLRVTVMMFRDMVESVMLLKEDARSVCLKRCFRRRHLCLRISREEVLCSVELLSRLVLSSSSESIKLLDSSSLLSTVDALSGGSPRSRLRSPLRCPLVRAASSRFRRRVLSRR